jgi:GntR family transcriptional regulator
MMWQVDSSAPAPLAEQIAASVRRALVDGTLVAGERLPPAQELAAVLDLNANTVLVAFRRLRAEGLLEFRRGRGVRVPPDAAPLASVTAAARQLLEEGRRHGFTTGELTQLVRDLSGAATP